MKLLDQRVSKLEKAMNERPPNLYGMSVEELVKLLHDNIHNVDRTDLILRGMSDEQMDQVHSATAASSQAFPTCDWARADTRRRPRAH